VRPIAIIQTTPEFHRLGNDVLIAVGKPLGIHAVVVVGAAEVAYTTNPALNLGDVVLLVQNSWGVGWADNGFGLVGPDAWDAMAKAIVQISAV
jgi:hypothetical protein